MAEETGKKVGRQKVPVAEVRIYVAKPIGAGAFNGIRERLVRSALVAQPGRVVEDAVTAITCLKRTHNRCVDTFSLMCDDILNEFMGTGVFAIHSTSSGAAVKLIPPLDFELRARRGDAGDVLLVKELVVKAHFACLVPDHSNLNSPIFRLDITRFDYPLNWTSAYRRAMAAQILAAPQPPLLNNHIWAGFQSWASQQ